MQVMSRRTYVRDLRAQRPGLPACPACGSTRVLPVLYGYPNALMRTAAAAGKVLLGGCAVDLDVPNWGCRLCGHTWITAAERSARRAWLRRH